MEELPTAGRTAAVHQGTAADRHKEAAGRTAEVRHMRQADQQEDSLAGQAEDTRQAAHQKGDSPAAAEDSLVGQTEGKHQAGLLAAQDKHQAEHPLEDNRLAVAEDKLPAAAREQLLVEAEHSG